MMSVVECAVVSQHSRQGLPHFLPTRSESFLRSAPGPRLVNLHWTLSLVPRSSESESKFAQSGHAPRTSRCTHAACARTSILRLPVSLLTWKVGWVCAAVSAGGWEERHKRARYREDESPGACAKRGNSETTSESAVACACKMHELASMTRIKSLY